MIKNKSVLAIIPARKGSKRLVGKNMLDLKGKPLIAWTIEEALKSNYIDNIIISTDDENIINLSRQYKGINVPFVSPKELSSDKATSLDVVLHALNYYSSNDKNFDYVMLLQPTSPLRKSKDIDYSIEELSEEVKSVVSVCETDHSPLWSNRLPDNKSMKNFLSKEIKNLRSQDLPKYYRLNGAIYISEVEYLVKEKGFLGNQTKAYNMPIERSIDVDTKIDLELCKILLNENNKNNS